MTRFDGRLTRRSRKMQPFMANVSRDNTLSVIDETGGIGDQLDDLGGDIDGLTGTVTGIDAVVDQHEIDLADHNGKLVAVSFARYLSMPAIRGFWPFSSINESANCVDMSGQGRTLTGSGSRSFAVMTNGGVYAAFNGSDTYFYRADEAGLDVTTNLTLMGWFYMGASTAQVLAAKANTSNYSYQLSSTAANRLRLYVSNDGTTLPYVESASNYTAARWYFIAGRYTASTELALFWYAAVNDADGGKATNTTSIPASLYNGTAQFRVGASQLGYYLNGRAAYVALVTYALSDAMILGLYQATKGLFTA